LANLIEVPNPPAISRNDFNCPHCGAHSNQTWFKLAADPIDKGGTPSVPDNQFIAEIRADRNIDNEMRDRLIRWAEEINSGLVFLERVERGHYSYHTVNNLHLSKCFTCKKIAVWVHDNLVFPNKLYTVPPNQDLPEDVRRDYEEAGEILDKSPRGSAALLRLAIQKLCIHLGEPGKNINTDIASLIKRGLDKRVQQALDVVRVIGNNALHPGQMDIKDDKDTARTLFGLVNLIAEKMIGEPKHVQNLFESLPEGARKQIEERDK
jgi:hypothetical protein